MSEISPQSGIEKNKRLESSDINREKLRALFPTVFLQTIDSIGEPVESVDIDELASLLGIPAKNPEPVSEQYGLNWPGKRDSLRLIHEPSNTTLVPCPEESINFDETDNMFIEGDNLEVLKLLHESHTSKIKMIYIDPPYNSGKEFVYTDDYSESLKTYLSYASTNDTEPDRSSSKCPNDGRYHAKWLNMMYPRLYLARRLLREDGAIFISIGNNEVANLRKMCDEIFGEENFIESFCWTTKKGAQGIPTRSMVVSNHEYVLCYAKDAAHFSFKGLDRDKSQFSNPDNDPRGDWKRQYLQRFGQNFKERTIVNPENGMTFRFETPYTETKMKKWVEEGRIIFPTDPTKYPARKEFLSEYKNKKQLVSYLGLYPTKASTERLYELFDGVKIFTNPKPVALIEFLIKATTDAVDDIVLDLFAGSCTTAHAVLNLNHKENSKRSFIMVQLPEPCNEKSGAAKAEFATIADIGKERIRRVINKIKSEQKQDESADSEGFSSTVDANPKLDLGFKVLKLRQHS